MWQLAERKRKNKSSTLWTKTASPSFLHASLALPTLFLSLVHRVYANARRMSLPFPLCVFSPSRERETERESILCLRTLCRRLRRMRYPVGVFVRLKSPQWDGYAVALGASSASSPSPRPPAPRRAIDCPSTRCDRLARIIAMRIGRSHMPISKSTEKKEEYIHWCMVY